MSKDLQRLEDFVITMAAKGNIQLDEYIELVDCVYGVHER